MRDTATCILHVVAQCRDCGWECFARNATGVAAQHSDRTGHWVGVEQVLGIQYRPRFGEEEKAS